MTLNTHIGGVIEGARRSLKAICRSQDIGVLVAAQTVHATPVYTLSKRRPHEVGPHWLTGWRRFRPETGAHTHFCAGSKYRAVFRSRDSVFGVCAPGWILATRIRRPRVENGCAKCPSPPRRINGRRCFYWQPIWPRQKDSSIGLGVWPHGVPRVLSKCCREAARMHIYI